MAEPDSAFGLFNCVDLPFQFDHRLLELLQTLLEVVQLQMGLCGFCGFCGLRGLRKNEAALKIISAPASFRPANFFQPDRRFVVMRSSFNN